MPRRSTTLPRGCRSQTPLYYYVKNKDEILLECVKKGHHLILKASRPRARQAATRHQLRACMQVYADIVTQPFGMCIIRIGDEEVLSPAAPSCAA